MKSTKMEAEGSASDAEAVDSEQDLYNVIEDGFEICGVQHLYMCSLCDFNSTGPLGIVEHIRTHSRETPWDCIRCNNALNGIKIEDADPHDPSCLDHLGNGSVFGCQEIFVRPKSREEHKCTLCPYKSVFLSEVVAHIGKHMRKRREQDPLDDDEGGAMFQKSWHNVYSCTECEFSCVRPDKLEKHMESHAPGAKFKCAECGWELSSRKALQTHKRTVHGYLKPFECLLCSAKFTRMDNLKTHVKNHTGQRRYSCRLCAYAAPSKARLIAHYNSHKDGQPRERGMANCPVCRRSYTNYPCLEIHRKTHALTPPYACKQCGVVFETERQLYDHHTDHVDAQALSCAFCDFKCFDDSSIHNHLGAVHGSEKPFQCDICNYRFSSLVHWKRHQLVHTGEKPFSCDLCSAKFSQSGNRKAHMIKIHNLYIPLPKGQRRQKVDPHEEIVIFNE